MNPIEDARAFCQRTFPQALALHQSGRLDEARALYERILAADAAHVDALHLLGVLAYQAGRSDVAAGLIGRALAIEPRFAEAQDNLGNALLNLGKVADAAECHARAAALKPDFAEAHCHLGNALRMLGRHEEAVASCRRALALRPGYAEAWLRLGAAQKAQGLQEDALRSFEAAAEADPRSANAWSMAGGVLRGLGRNDDAIAAYRRALEIAPDFEDAASALIFSLNFDAHRSPAACLAEARAYGERVAAKRGRRFDAWRAERDPARLRVGFVSGDFHRHPVAYFLEGLLDHLDRARVELFAYHAHNRWDDVTERLRPRFDQWKLVSRLGDEAVAEAIHADGVHVLIDLSGHTARNRLPMFAWKPAPVQASWLGYFATTGVAEMDYLIADPHVAPPSEEGHFSEMVWRLPETYLCFTPPPVDIAVAPLPARASGTITFGCFNNLAKLNDAVVALWARVLHAVPDARLFLKTKQLASVDSGASMRARFGAHGIAPERLILEGASPRHELLAAYHRVDIALDPFPYPGGTTSVEAMWMGVPVLTRRGDRFLSRVGESIAHNAGLAEWIAADDDDYVARAVRHGADLDALDSLRAGLRERVMASPLFDAARFARHFERALWAMWERHRASFNLTTREHA